MTTQLKLEIAVPRPLLSTYRYVMTTQLKLEISVPRPLSSTYRYVMTAQLGVNSTRQCTCPALCSTSDSSRGEKSFTSNCPLIRVLPSALGVQSQGTCREAHSRSSPPPRGQATCNALGLIKVPCAPKGFDFECPVIKTTKLLVETRPGTLAKRIHP